MKTKIMIVIALLAVLFSRQSAPAVERNFPAGSLIIPMDDFYQPEADGGIFEAYGLVYYLLSMEGDDKPTLYWIIDKEKTAIGDPDCVIEDLTLAAGDHVAKLYDHAGGSTVLTYDAGDTFQRIEYRGAPWIIDAADVAKARTVIDQSDWAAVEVHVAQVPFSAMVDKELKGTPPLIALMDSSENGGNAKILRSYLRLAGICTDVYEVLTPNDIRDGLLNLGDYDFMWAPHWHGSASDNNDNGLEDRQEIVDEIKAFLQSGKSLLAECGSITDFENYGLFLTSGGIDKNGGTNNSEDIIYNNLDMPYSQIGDYGYEPTGGSVHNWRPIGGSDTYNDTVTRFVIDNTGWDYYVGGYAFGDTNNGYAVYLGGHSYASCGSPPEEDNPDPNIARLDIEFEKNLFVDVVSQNTHEIKLEFEQDITDESFTLLVKYDGGLQSSLTFSKDTLSVRGGTPLEINLTTAAVNGKKIEHMTFTNNRGSTVSIESITVSWSGGHADQLFKKIEDRTTGQKPYDQPSVASGVELATTDFTLEGVASGDTYTLLFSYNEGASTEVSFNSTNPSAKAGDPLEVELTDAYVDGNKLRSLVLRNIGSQIVEVDSVTVSWIGGPDGQTTNRVYDLKTGTKIYDQPKLGSGVAPIFLEHIELPPLLAAVPSGCVDNDDCSWRDVGAVRYVLNTLFNIKFYISSREYVRAPPIIQHPYLYQGSFEWPSYRGHFRRYDVTLSGEEKDADWDTAEEGIKAPKNKNSDGNARLVYTAKKNVDGTWSKIDFDGDNMAELRAALDLTPDNDDDSDENAVITRIRGHYWDHRNSIWRESSNKLGGIMHSAPVIVGSKTRADVSRDEIAYVGDLYGMLHAITITDGKEQWAFIPRNLLGKLKNDRTDVNAVQDFAGVDASPTAKDVYYDHDGDGDDEWRTILAGSEGFGGTSIYALDVTDPANWTVLWEATDTIAPGGGMGHAYRVAIDKVKWPIADVDDVDDDGDTAEIIDHQIKWVVFVSTGFAHVAVDHGGIHVFAFDLKTGTQLWHFSSEYADSVNDIPGAATVYDLDGDTFADRVYVGDMNGRMWELEAIDGSNPNGTEGTGDDTKEIPLYNAGIGNPISVSPAIVRSGGHTTLIFGTGGTDWAADDQAYAVYAIDATTRQSVPTYADGAGTLLWKVDLAVGEKVWSTPTVAYGYIFLATAFGSMEGSDPRSGIPAEGQASGNFLKLKLADGSEAWRVTDIGKVRGSVFVDRQHAYMTTIDGNVIQIGGDDFAAGIGNRVVLRTWRQM